MEFEWDDEKAESNFRKHGIRFQDAVKAFDDQYGIELLDEFHSDDEVRYHLIASTNGLLLLVAFTERIDAIRIISARKADNLQTRIYYERKG